VYVAFPLPKGPETDDTSPQATTNQVQIYTQWFSTIVSSGLTGDLIWQAGSTLTNGQTPNDGYAVYPGTDVYSLVTSSAASLKAARQ
jgi:mannan endo-1,4-beta-mannosidase